MDSKISGEELQRGERFLAAYARIEHVLTKRFQEGEGRSTFRRLVDLGSKEDALLRKYKDDLCRFADLRNAIVHERISPDYLIAVPLPEILEKIEAVARLLVEPPQVYPLLEAKVISFSVGDPLSDVISVIVEKGYSQFPVFSKEKYEGLLTDSGLARFFAGAAMGKVSLSSKTTVADAITYEKDVWRGKFIGKNASLYDAEDLFGRLLPGGFSLSALFITEDGEESPDLLASSPPHDILRLRGSGELGDL